MEIGHERLLVGSVVHFAIHSGLDCAGKDRIDPNAPWSKLGGECLGQADQTGFTSGIGGDTRKCEAVADESRGKDHRPAAMLQHLGDLGLGTQETPVRLIAMASSHPFSDTSVLGPASPSVPAL